MTALNDYQRLESAGLWRGAADAQRRDVIVSIGEATLVLTDSLDRPLAHWSLAALMRANPGETPAIYYAEGDPDETLELGQNEAEMIAALEKLRHVIDRRRPRPGRLRLWLGAVLITTIVLGGLFWLPGALLSHAVSVIPEVKRAELGAGLLAQMERVTGASCHDANGPQSLGLLAQRIAGEGPPPHLSVVRDGVRGALYLPGHVVLINRSLIEDFEEPDVVAGHVLAEMLRAQASDPLTELLSRAGIGAILRMLTTGTLTQATLQNHAVYLLTGDRPRPSDAAILERFASAGVRSSPYARAIDVTGETVLGLIEADPYASIAPAPLLSDADWLRLQAICGG